MSTFIKYILQLFSQLMVFLKFVRTTSAKKEVIQQKEDIKKTEKHVRDIVADKKIDEINEKFGWK